jgi:hypothetical protein
MEDHTVTDKRTMTLNLTSHEMTVLEELAKRKELTKTQLIRQALKLYQLVDARITAGERLVFEGESDEKKSEVIVL